MFFEDARTYFHQTSMREPEESNFLPLDSKVATTFLTSFPKGRADDAFNVNQDGRHCRLCEFMNALLLEKKSAFF